MNRAELVRTLAVYRRSREQLVAELVSEAPELYHAMFEFKPGSVAMRLALDRYVFLWLARHPGVYHELYLSIGEKESSDEEELFERFMKRYHDYCKCFILNDNAKTEELSGAVDNPVISGLLKHKIAFLENLLKVNRNADACLQGMRYQSTKAKVLFERQFDELRRQKNGTGSSK